MAYTDSFDDFLSTERQMDQINQPPFALRDEKDEEGTLEWLTQNFDNQERGAHSRRITYRRYQALYKNIQWRFFDTRDTRRDTNDNNNRRPRHSVNFIREMVDSRAAQNARLKINLAFIPNNDESADVNNARACKLFYDGYAEENELELLHQEQDEITFLFGHSMHFVEWDEDIGPLHPVYENLKKEYPDGIPKDILKKFKKELRDKGEIRVGDVRTEVLGPDRFYVEGNKPLWKDIDHIERIDYIHADTLKEMYPSKANEIMDNQRQIYDFDSAELIRPQNQIVVRTFYHKPTKFFPEGCKIIYTDDCILEWIDFPYDHGKLPCVPDKDIYVYGEFWGRSFIQDIEQMQRYYNNVQSSQARDHSWASAPKWMMPKGACNVHSLGNDLTVIEYSGPMAPQLVTHNFTPPQSFELKKDLESKISKHSKVYDISRGEVPTGVTANSALRFLDEQESQVILPQETKRKRRVVNVARMILATMQQYYKEEDGRMLRTLGEGNEYLIKSMQGADFTRIYDVRVQNSSALPDTKTGKIAAIIDLNTATQTDPIFTKNEVIEMLDLGNDEMFKSRATVSVRAANTSFDAMMKGEEIAPPQPFDDLMTFYSVFSKGIQQFSFKGKTEGPIKERIGLYIATLERLMFERAKVNMKFAAELMENDQYPMFFKPDMPLSKIMAAHQMDAMGAQAEVSTPNTNIDTSKVEKPQQGA